MHNSLMIKRYTGIQKKTLESVVMWVDFFCFWTIHIVTRDHEIAIDCANKLQPI